MSTWESGSWKVPNPRAGIFAPVLSVFRVARVVMERADGCLRRAACAKGVDFEKRGMFAVIEAMVAMSTFFTWT